MIKIKKKKDNVSFIEMALIILIALVVFSGSILPLVMKRNAIYLGMLSIFIFQMLLKKKKIYFNNIIQLQWIVILAFLAFNMLYTIDVKKLAIVLFQYIVYTLMLIMHSSENFYKKILSFFLNICTILGIIVIITVIDKNFIVKNFSFLYSSSTLKSIIGRTNGNAFGGILGEVSYSAFAMNIGIAIIVSKFFSKEKLTVINYIQLMIFVLGILVSFKRSLMLIPIFAFLIMFLISSTSKKLKKRFNICNSNNWNSFGSNYNFS